MSGLQILALLSGLAGLGATIGATVSNEWRATSRASSVITATWVLQGLWNNCAGNAIGALHCRPHHSILQLEGKPREFHSDHMQYLHVLTLLYDAFISANNLHNEILSKQWKHIYCSSIAYVLTYGEVLYTVKALYEMFLMCNLNTLHHQIHITTNVSSRLQHHVSMMYPEPLSCCKNYFKLSFSIFSPYFVHICSSVADTQTSFPIVQAITYAMCLIHKVVFRNAFEGCWEVKCYKTNHFQECFAKKC